MNAHCPSRASTALARGDFTTAWALNPASFLLSLWSSFVLGRLLLSRFWGRRLNVLFRANGPIWASLAVALGVLGVNRQAHAELILLGTV